MTKEAVAAKLATFSDDELVALGLSRKLSKSTRRSEMNEVWGGAPNLPRPCHRSSTDEQVVTPSGLLC